MVYVVKCKPNKMSKTPFDNCFRNISNIDVAFVFMSWHCIDILVNI